MGTETIKDPILRSNWDKLIKIIHSELNEQQIDLEFTSFKNDGTYGKAKHSLPGVWFAFAEVSVRTWVELEIKARQSMGIRYSQDSLYSFLRENYKCSTVSNKYRITWNQEDIETTPRDPQGMDIRIKTYLDNPKTEVWIEAMTHLAKDFLPLLEKYQNLA